jgi:hypothetical protein
VISALLQYLRSSAVILYRGVSKKIYIVQRPEQSLTLIHGAEV